MYGDSARQSLELNCEVRIIGRLVVCVDDHGIKNGGATLVKSFLLIKICVNKYFENVIFTNS